MQTLSRRFGLACGPFGGSVAKGMTEIGYNGPVAYMVRVAGVLDITAWRSRGSLPIPLTRCVTLYFYEMPEAVADSNHPNHAEAAEWLDAYDANVIDELKYALGRIANRRNAAKTPLANKKQTPSTG
jgi:hypothetical protein